VAGREITSNRALTEIYPGQTVRPVGEAALAANAFEVKPDHLNI
jgi:hypothetical protein